MILFFGCWVDKGHYMHDRTGARPRWYQHRRRGGVTERWETVVPWGANVDSGLAPRTEEGNPEPNGVAAYHVAQSFIGRHEVEFWSALSWWDNSVDTRPGSNCSFIADSKWEPEVLLELARKEYPQIFARFKYEIILPAMGLRP